MRRKPDNLFWERYPLLHGAYAYYRTGSWELLRYYDEGRLRYRDMLKAAEGYLPNGELYLNSALHDGRVTSIERESRHATVWLNDYPTHSFCHALGNFYQEKALNWDTVLPLGIRFHDVTRFSLARIGRSYKILPVSISRHLPHVYELFYDEARRIEPGHVEIGMLLMSTLYKGNKAVLLLEVSCGRIEFIEQQREQFVSLLGGGHLDLFDAYWEARHNGVYFDYSSSFEFIQQWKPVGANPPLGSCRSDGSE